VPHTSILMYGHFARKREPFTPNSAEISPNVRQNLSNSGYSDAETGFSSTPSYPNTGHELPRPEIRQTLSSPRTSNPRSNPAHSRGTSVMLQPLYWNESNRKASG